MNILWFRQARLGTLSRSHANTTMELNVSAGRNQKLSILVENQGRINDKKYLEDRKVSDFQSNDYNISDCNSLNLIQGILSNVTLGKHILGPWTMTGYPLNETSWLNGQDLMPDVKPPAFYRGIFIVPNNRKHTKPLDTYLDTFGWTKVCQSLR